MAITRAERESERQARETLAGGDLVFIKIEGREPREVVVERTTRTRIVVEGHQYGKKDGTMYGLRRSQADRTLWIPREANHRWYLEKEAQAEVLSLRKDKINDLVYRFRSLACRPDVDLGELDTVLEEFEARDCSGEVARVPLRTSPGLPRWSGRF